MCYMGVQLPPREEALLRGKGKPTVMYRWRGSATGRALDFAISRLRGQLAATLHNNLGQVVYTYVPLSPSSITWYRPKGGDALRLGR